MITTRQLFFANLAQTIDTPLALEIESAAGNYLYDTAGKKYLDLLAGISVSNVGHLHPKVVAAIQNQLTKHMHIMVYGEFVLSPQVLLAQKITSLLPKKFESVYLTNSGAEAIEGTIKLAKRYTGRNQIISFKNAYHGSTNGALSLMGDEYFKRAYRPLLPGTKQINFNDFADLEKISCRTAAVFVEPVQGEAGYIPAQRDYLKALRKKCTEMGALLVFDEIQTGIGRTGSWFAMHHFGITPDVVVLAKGLGGGMPIGAFVAQKKVMDVFKDNPILGHITTFGGHPVSCAAALATLNVVEEVNLMADVSAKSAQFRRLLKHPKINSISGVGLMLAVDLGSFEAVQKTMNYCIENGVITDWFLFNSSCIRISPPLTITSAEIDFACRIILDSLKSDATI